MTTPAFTPEDGFREWDLRLLERLQPTLRQIDRFIKAREIEAKIGLGYSARAACLECGTAPTSGYRWLAWVRSLDAAQYSADQAAQPKSDNDIPF